MKPVKICGGPGGGHCGPPGLDRDVGRQVRQATNKSVGEAFPMESFIMETGGIVKKHKF